MIIKQSGGVWNYAVPVVKAPVISKMHLQAPASAGATAWSSHDAAVSRRSPGEVGLGSVKHSADAVLSQAPSPRGASSFAKTN
jgi:hypothetical protein